MHIDTHLLGDIEELEWDYLTIRHDDEVVTVICSEFTQEFWIISNFEWLQYWDIVHDREILHWARSHQLISAERLVRIGHGEHDLHTRCSDEILENSGRERWGTKKSNTHRK